MTFPIKFSWRLIGLWYLALPVALFFFTWLRAPYNIIFAFITIGLGTKYSIDLSKSQRRVQINYRYLMLTFCISLLFAVVSGAGGFVWQKPDWTKHNVVLNDLINYRWPVYYGPSAYVKDTTLVYYVAYYLPAALVGKLFGWRAGELGLFVQSLLGLIIFAQLIGENIRCSSKKYLIFFLLSGADIIGILLFRDLNTVTHTSIIHLEQYATSLQFSSVLTQLMWVPQHALAGWIAVLLAYKDYREDKTIHTLPLYVAITLIWSPFVSFGLAMAYIPFVISPKIKQYFNIYSIFSAFIIGMILLYYQSQIQVLNNNFKIYLFSNIHILNNFGMMIAFLILDLYIFAIVIITVKDKMHANEKKLITWLFIVLVLIAQLMYGVANDFVMRVSIPALTLIFILVLQYIDVFFQKNSVVTFLIGFLLICGLCSPLVEIYQSLHKSSDAVNEKPVYPMINAHLRYKVLHQQYMGLATKAFGRYFGNYILDQRNDKK